MRHLWVIEMHIESNWKHTAGVGWKPTYGVTFRKKSALLDIAEWRKMCPDDKFRITKYIPNNIRPDGTLIVGEE